MCCSESGITEQPIDLDMILKHAQAFSSPGELSFCRPMLIM